MLGKSKSLTLARHGKLVLKIMLVPAIRPVFWTGSFLKHPFLTGRYFYEEFSIFTFLEYFPDKASSMTWLKGKDKKLLVSTVDYLVWWKLSDACPDLIRQCEAKFMCYTSRLKSDDPLLKSATPMEKMCELCDTFATDDVRHHILV